jgi:hypothetical protein
MLGAISDFRYRKRKDPHLAGLGVCSLLAPLPSARKSRLMPMALEWPSVSLISGAWRAVRQSAGILAYSASKKAPSPIFQLVW